MLPTLFGAHAQESWMPFEFLVPMDTDPGLEQICKVCPLKHCCLTNSIGHYVMVNIIGASEKVIVALALGKTKGLLFMLMKFVFFFLRNRRAGLRALQRRNSRKPWSPRVKKSLVRTRTHKLRDCSRQRTWKVVREGIPPSLARR